MSVIDKILAQLDSLTPEERQALRTFLQQEPLPGSVQSHNKRADQIKGKYSFVPTSSEAFASRKKAEIQLEQRPEQ